MTIIHVGTMKFRNEPVEIEAILFDGSNATEVINWVGSDLCEYCITSPGPSLLITTPEGARRADEGDWIIKGNSGEFYPYKPDLFATKFRPVQSE